MITYILFYFTNTLSIFITNKQCCSVNSNPDWIAKPGSTAGVIYISTKACCSGYGCCFSSCNVYFSNCMIGMFTNIKVCAVSSYSTGIIKTGRIANIISTAA